MQKMNVGAQKKLQRPLIAGHGKPQAADATRHDSLMERLSARAIGMRRKAATALVVVSSVCLGVYAIVGHDGLVAYQHKHRQVDQLHRQIQNLQKENERLALHDQRLQSDPDTIEYEAREEMHYTRPGEVIYTLPQAPVAAQHK